MTQPYGEPLTPEWRLAHVVAGDLLLAHVQGSMTHGRTVNALDLAGADLNVQRALAHYAAANVRARPPASDPMPSTLPSWPHGEPGLDP